jgi:hypothetical protein
MASEDMAVRTLLRQLLDVAHLVIVTPAPPLVERKFDLIAQRSDLYRCCDV